MNWNERQALKDRIRTQIANRMIRNGEIKRDETHENSMLCARVIELIWKGTPFTITEVDGLVCRIDKGVAR